MAGQPATGAGLFTQVSRGATLAEQVTGTITAAIMDGTLAPGEQLPSERDLGEQFGVSRTVIREAVRSLVAGGLVEARSGRRLQVAEVGPEAVSHAINVFLHRSETIEYEAVHEVRTALEIDMAGYAAERAGAADLARLTELNDELAAVAIADADQAAALDVAFHHAIAQATQNGLFAVLLEAIGERLIEIRRRALDTPGLRANAIEGHRQILERLAAGDPAGARAAMRRHLETTDDLWKAENPAPS